MTHAQDLLSRLEATLDAIPRVGGAHVEQVGPFDLFFREGPGWPYYARPRLGCTKVGGHEVVAVLERQRALGVPQSIEWVDATTPELLPVVVSLGLSVVQAPLMVLDPRRLPEAASTAACLLDPSSSTFAGDVAVSSAVAALAFGAPGTTVGLGGPTERDAAIHPVDPGQLDQFAAGIRDGRSGWAVVSIDEGIVAQGAFQAALGAAEIVGVATLPSYRRRGLGAAVSALLARTALDRGHDLVFLSAANEDVARVYASIGFRREGISCILEPPTHPLT